MSRMDLAPVTDLWALCMRNPLSSYWAPQAWLGVSKAEPHSFPELYNSQGKDLTGVLSKNRKLKEWGSRGGHIPCSPFLGLP